MFQTNYVKNHCNFFKKETLAQVFFCEFCEISKNTFFYRIRPVAAPECFHLDWEIHYIAKL